MAHKERACHPPPAPFLGPSSSPGSTSPWRGLSIPLSAQGCSRSRALSDGEAEHVPLWKPACPDSGTRKVQLSDGSAPVALSRPGSWLLWSGQEALWLSPGLPPPRPPAPDVRAGASGWGDQEGGFPRPPILPSCPPGHGAPPLG